MHSIRLIFDAFERSDVFDVFNGFNEIFDGFDTVTQYYIDL